jgi:hypothetical protein
MSTQNIDISRKNVIGKCDLKCAYNFKYTQSNSTAKNNGVNITLTYDNTSVPPVLYNNQPYIVSNVVINCPSVHYFNSSQLSGEITIEHTPVKGGPNLYVCIPINSSTESSDATVVLDEIIESVAINAPVEGETTNLNLSNYNLQNIVPNKPFYSYTDDKNNDFIVFGILEAIPLNSTTLTTLSQIIKPFPISTIGGSLFYNSSGPNSSDNIGGGIYISCKPTGESEEEIPVDYSKNTSTYNFSNMMKSPIFKLIIQFIIGLLLSIIVFTIISYIYSFLTTGAAKLPTKPKFTG